MKDIRFDISLYIIIPLIIGGIALLATISSYNVAIYYYKRGLDPFWPVAFWGSVTVIVTAIFGLLIVKFIIGPVKKFARSTENMVVFSTVSENNRAAVKTDDMGRFTQLFNQVTEILGQVEARELFPDIVGQSKAVRGVLKQILDVAKTDSTVLILGETGTGKELIANSIHRHSSRKNNTFVAFNCAAIPEGLLESELFGHEKGAFTGAISKKIGKFQSADKSTLFMDEIGDMPLETQAKVLRAVQEGEFERVGGIKPISFDARFITATNQDLSKLVEEGHFRQDLYFRLNVFTIVLPPLRHRREDIPLLVDRFLENYDHAYNISSDAMQLLTAHDWPGNVREL
ncbi:MAG: sigma 54-interacting transcriptional regulator, partial [Deltaproteobacteria bacterium]|nr:sigma 54-interacting transcriptional regulator [Deltaproteobacteria bacterium]